MKLVPFERKHTQTGNKVTFYSLEYSQVPGDPVITVEHNGVARLIPRRIITNIIHFSRRVNTLEAYYLQHDCSVFALACQTGETYKDEQLFGPGQRFVRRNWETQLDPYKPSSGRAFQHPAFPGKAVMGARIDATGNIEDRTHHVMVRATMPDDYEPLYASKLGITGIAVVHTLHEALNYYASDLVTPIDLSLIAPTPLTVK